MGGRRAPFAAAAATSPTRSSKRPWHNKRTRVMPCCASRGRRPRQGIRMKLSINSGGQRKGFLLLVHALTQYLCGSSSFARRFRRQTFCGGTSSLEKTAQCAVGLKDGVHPPISRGLDMPDDFAHTPCPLFLHPHSRPPLWVERLREQKEQHAAIEIPEGGVVFFCLDRCERPRTLPRFTDQCDWPTERIGLEASCYLP
jgi:hypothetical protein